MFIEFEITQMWKCTSDGLIFDFPSLMFISEVLE